MTDNERAWKWIADTHLEQCVVESEVAALVALLAKVREEADKAADARWCAALEAADWDGGVFHHEGRIYPWPRGFVPDCPATWAQRLRDMAKQVESGALRP